MLTWICGITLGQDRIKNLTVSIVDTSSSKYEQTNQIYNWITRHISYDLKSYIKNSSTSQTSIETLNRRKGLCMDYAQLFKDMCESAGIECYLVFGYSKGFDYEKGDSLYRADHCWNVVHTDSAWINIDPTWGSGSVEQRPYLTELFKNILFRIPPVGQRSVFVSNPTENYFNFSYNKPNPTHLPLDPKWQFLSFPVSIKEFESDSFTYIKRAEYYNVYELEMVKQVPWSRQLFLEGINGKNFNPRNNFDIATGYLLENQDFNYKTWIVKHANLSETKWRLKNFSQSHQYIMLYSHSIDSFIKSKIEKLRSTQNLSKNLRENIKTTSKRSRKRIDKKVESIFNRENALYRKIVAYEFRIRNIQKKNLNNIAKLKDVPAVLYYEVYHYIQIKTDIGKVNAKCDSLNRNLINYIRQSKELLEKDFNLINNIYKSLEEFQLALTNYKSVIAQKDSREIIQRFNMLDSAYKSIKNMISVKQKNLAQFNKTINQCLSITREIVWELEMGMSEIRYHYKISKNDSLANTLFESLKTSIESEYHTSIELTNLSLAINSSQTDYNENFNIQINAIRKISKPLLAYLANYLEFTIVKQERVLEREKALSKTIEKATGAGMKNLKLKLAQFESKSKNTL